MSEYGAPGVEFREVQQFRQLWLWLLLVPLNLAIVGVFGYGMVQQLILGRPWGDRPLPDAALAMIGPLALLLGLGMLWLLRSLRLTTEIREDGIHLRFPPFPSRLIPFDDVEACTARTYRPLAEYGGWGVRWGRGGRAYNVSGNRGAQLQLLDGTKLLIGSQQADDLAQAISRRLQARPFRSDPGHR